MTSQLAVTWIGTIIILGMYFLPGYIASHRHHSNVMPIFITNGILGWTGIGWIACLIWSVSDHVQPKEELSVKGQAS